MISLLLPAGSPAQAAERCGVAHDSINITDHGIPGGRVRFGAVNMNVNWCWDGAKITNFDAPHVWSSTTRDGYSMAITSGTPAQFRQDPANGGYWTVETIVDFTVKVCVVVKDICVRTMNLRLDMLVFGDGVTHIKNRRKT